MSTMEMRIEDNKFYERATEKLDVPCEELPYGGVIFHEFVEGIDLLIRKSIYKSPYTGKPLGGSSVVVSVAIPHPLGGPIFEIKRRITNPKSKNVVSCIKKLISTMLQKRNDFEIMQRIAEKALPYHGREDFQLDLLGFCYSKKPYFEMNYEELMITETWLNSWVEANNKTVDTEDSK